MARSGGGVGKKNKIKNALISAQLVERLWRIGQKRNGFLVPL